MATKLDMHVLDNGLVILGEPMEGVGSAAFCIRLPAGEAVFDAGCCGAGGIITDWVFRGAGDRSSRQLTDALDSLGIHRNSSVMSSHIVFGGALEAGNLDKGLDIYADVILRPRLDAEQFELSKSLSLADLAGLDDDPRHKVMLSLYEQFYPSPLGRPTSGRVAEVEKLDAGKVSGLISKHFNMSGAILSVAGKYDFDAVCRQAEELFGGAKGQLQSGIELGQAGRDYTHIQHDGAQVHIALMTKTVPITSKDYYNARAAVSILSGGMSSRLFTEVREKRGLCYAVGAQYNTLKNCAGISCYAGTTPDKAQETLDVIKAEFERLSQGITECEMQRAKVGLKSSIIMQSESSSFRAGSAASDYYLLGRVRSIDQVKKSIDGLSVDSVMEFLNSNRFENYNIVTIGPKEVKTGV